MSSLKSNSAVSSPDDLATGNPTPGSEPDESRQEERSSRRSFVFFGALAAGALIPNAARAQGRARQRKPIEQKPSDQFQTVPQYESATAFQEWDPAGVSRLVRRVTYSATPADFARATQLGWQGYLNEQLNYSRINDDAVEATIAQKWPLMSASTDALFASDTGEMQAALRESTLYRSAFSRRQLYQRMVEFWTDHFNQAIDKVQFTLYADQRDVIRKHAMGRFPDLLKASAHSASMMEYLDQNTNRSGQPNQNYAREIMELHTLGVDGGYTQDDVAELSRVLTGWNVEGKGQFVFNPTIHDKGTKTVLGQTIAGISRPGRDQRGRADARLPRQSSEHGEVHRHENAQVAARSEPDRSAGRDRGIGVQGDGGRHQSDDPRDPQRYVAAGGAHEAQAAVPFGRLRAALREPDGRRSSRRSPTSSSISVTRSSRGKPPMASPTKWNIGRATPCRGGISLRCSRARMRHRTRSPSIRRRIVRARTPRRSTCWIRISSAARCRSRRATRSSRTRVRPRSPMQRRAS